MRIAISGSHRSGKTTLIEELAALLPKYTEVDEPYHLMEEEGYEFSQPPSLEDFAAQLEYSIRLLRGGAANGSGSAANVLFDRCPADFLAYILAHENAETFDLDECLPVARAAIETLDLIVLVPLETRDRIIFSSSDGEGDSREIVDEKLKEILLDDPFEIGVEVLVVDGGLQTRLRTVMQRISRRP